MNEAASVVPAASRSVIVAASRHSMVVVISRVRMLSVFKGDGNKIEQIWVPPGVLFICAAGAWREPDTSSPLHLYTTTTLVGINRFVRMERSSMQAPVN